MTNEAKIIIRPLTEADIPQIIALTDRVIGDRYFTKKKAKEILQKSSLGEKQFSLGLFSPNKALIGLRLTFPPGKWLNDNKLPINPLLWPQAPERTAYFKTLIVDPEWSGQGWGKRLSLEAIKLLKNSGALGIVCHSWKESPHDSSGRYLRGLGFVGLADHPHFWKDVDYICSRCEKKPCLCTAEEMYLDLSQ